MSLDQQYLDFVARTGPVFARFPRLEAWRYTLFKDIVAQGRGMSRSAMLKRRVRPLLHRECTSGPLDPADALIWLESERAIATGPLQQVSRELAGRGVSVRLVALNSPEALDVPTVHFRHPARALPPAWAGDAWTALCEEYPELDDPARRRYFEYGCANNAALLAELERVLDAIRPRIVVLSSTQLTGGAALVVAARARGIPSVLLQHGMVQPFYTPVVVDHMATWGEASNQTLIELGIPREKLVALGSPRHDTMQPGPAGAARRALLDTLGLPDQPTLVFFSNGNDLVRNGAAPQAIAGWLEDAAAEHGDRMNFVVRLHPNEDGSLYDGCSHLVVTRREVDLATTLDGCDLIGSFCSTVLYEALLYHKPVWQFYADGWPDLAGNWKTGLATRIPSPAALSAQIERMLDEGTGTFFDPASIDRVFANHGRATQAIAGFVQARLAGGDAS